MTEAIPSTSVAESTGLSSIPPHRLLQWNQWPRLSCGATDVLVVAAWWSAPTVSCGRDSRWPGYGVSAASEAPRRVVLRNLDGRVVDVEPGQTVLGAAEEAGVELPFGCRQGGCTTCAARLIEGELDQSAALALTETMAERGWVLLCVGRPLTETVVLDVGGAGAVHRRPGRRRA